MKIIDRIVCDFEAGKPSFSFEFFPPKDDEGTNRLFATIAELGPYAPTYVSVTYGAGGSTRRLTLELVERIKRSVGLEPMAHLTCVGATRDEIGEVLEQLRRAAIDNVLPLRGDPPRGSGRFEAVAGGFRHATELVEFIRSRYEFCLAGACYPEVHPEAESAEADILHLKRKVEAGIDFLITQLFFDNEDYFKFVDRARGAGIACPIIAGIMPITNLSQIKRFTSMCGARIPGQLLERLEATGGDHDEVQRIGVEHAVNQCRSLLARGAPGIHFYTLNRSRATVYVLEALKGASPA